MLHPPYGFLFLTAIAVSAPPALPADELSTIRLTVVAGDQPAAASGNPLRSDDSEFAASPAQSTLSRQEPSTSPTSASPSVSGEAVPKQLFSHAKWDGRAAVVPREPDLGWKDAFKARRPSVASDSGVVQTSGELPLATVQPVLLPNPPVKIGDSAGVPPARPQAAEPPPPVRIGPSTEPNVGPLPSLENQLVEQPVLAEKCTLPGDLKSIGSITADISVKREDQTGRIQVPPECSLGDTPMRPRHWDRITFAWTAASTCHNPIYFDDEQLERYGHSWGPVKQTAVSAVKFFATVPLVPYYMGVYPPNECVYDLGQYRPGSCAPYYLDPLPLSVRGALYEGAFLGLLPAM